MYASTDCSTESGSKTCACGATSTRVTTSSLQQVVASRNRYLIACKEDARSLPRDSLDLDVVLDGSTTEGDVPTALLSTDVFGLPARVGLDRDTHGGGLDNTVRLGVTEAWPLGR